MNVKMVLGGTVGNLCPRGRTQRRSLWLAFLVTKALSARGRLEWRSRSLIASRARRRVSHGAIGAILSLALSLTAHAQDAPTPAGRAERWRQQRITKLKDVRLQQLPAAEKSLLHLESGGLERILDFNLAGIRPKFGGMPTGSGFAAGIQYRRSIRESIIDVELTTANTTRGYQQYGFRLGRLGPMSNGGFGYADIGYLNYTQVDFFGLGPEARRADRSDFRQEQASYEGVGGYRFRSWLEADFRIGLLKTNVGRGTDERFPDAQDLFDNRRAPGLDSQPDFTTFSSSVVADFRDRDGNPRQGGLVRMSFSRFADRDDGLHSFNRFSVEGEHYMPLRSRARTLALRFRTSLARPDRGARVPFYLGETLGGSEALRGFRERRFRDANLVYLSSEYRWETVPAIELALFYDAGRVFAESGDFTLRGLSKSVGGGVRFKTADAVVLRLYVARSREGTRFYFKLGGPR